ncbi:hypothetical protein QZH41_001172 [Actinostola sp. cb2023]|nr:hypothetical protein QZH41_001172 [Actinostola sp. cb2023]
MVSPDPATTTAGIAPPTSKITLPELRAMTDLASSVERRMAHLDLVHSDESSDSDTNSPHPSASTSKPRANKVIAASRQASSETNLDGVPVSCVVVWDLGTYVDATRISTAFHGVPGDDFVNVDSVSISSKEFTTMAKFCHKCIEKESLIYTTKGFRKDIFLRICELALAM